MTGRGWKYKCGERGSAEEEQSDSKRTNMATVDGVTLVTEIQPPKNIRKNPA